MKHGYFILMHRESAQLFYAIKVHWDWYLIEDLCESVTYNEMRKRFKILGKGIQP